MTKENQRRLARLKQSLQTALQKPAKDRTPRDNKTIADLRKAIETLTKSKP